MKLNEKALVLFCTTFEIVCSVLVILMPVRQKNVTYELERCGLAS